MPQFSKTLAKELNEIKQVNKMEKIDNITKDEVEFLESVQCTKNKHGAYIFISHDGNEHIELSLFLYEYKQWLIDNKILTDYFNL